MSIPLRVARLVEHFHANRAELRAGRYNETQVRREFIDPFFKALGWDVDNETGVSEAYKDVIHEDAVKIGGVTKAPDYSFRVGGERKFFVEAKKPAVNLKADTSPAFQLRRYAWSANLPISILTDFEEFIVYDCRVKPDQGDRADTARVLYLTYDEYADRWDSIAGLFARDAVVHGALDQYVDTLKAHKGVATVDAAFLREIEAWRDSLARDIAQRNPGLGQRDLNFAVQMTIDRIIFLRMAEDRGIEPYGELLALGNGANVYERLTRMFRQADDRYNSGLFHFKREKGRESPDDLTLDLAVGDAPLKAIFKSLYYPDSPYEFSVLPIEILGHVYEQFLGKVITLTPQRGAVVEEKPEVRKAGGVYYTPTYIVDYIVEHTLGKLLEGKTPRQVAGAGKAAPLRVVDPACGSGSFLIGAYGYLLDWYRAAYVADGPQRHKKELYQGTDGEWRLTTAERKRILLDHIYGVDIDAQAVEVTKLSLLLKVLEGENRQVLARQMELFHERALPDLARNIQCGNSLIGPDFYAGQLGLLDEAARDRINVFDWRAAFPHVFGGDNPGFDAVIGNPPYIRIQTMKEWAPVEVEFYKGAYRAASKGNYDIYVVFVERGLSLLNTTGRLGFILPHKFFNAQYGQPLRQLIAEGRHLSEVVHFGAEQIFAGATTYTTLLFLNKAQQAEIEVVKVSDLDTWRRLGTAAGQTISSENVSGAEWNFNVGAGSALFERLSQLPTKLGDLTYLFVGLQTDADDVYIVEELRSQDGRILCHSKATGKDHWFENHHLKPFLKGSLNIRRYYFSDVTKRLIFPYETVNGRSVLIDPITYEREFPLTWAYLEGNQDRLKARNKGRMGNEWYGYVYKKNHTRFGLPKLLVPSLASGSCFAADLSGEYYFVGSGGGGGGGYGILVESPNLSYLYLLGLLNSTLLSVYLRTISTPFRGGYIALNRQYIEQLPIRTIDFADAADRARHDRLVALVEEMLRLHTRLAEARTPPAKTALQHQVDALDRQIDALVYALYGLTEEEIRIVEGTVNG